MFKSYSKEQTGDAGPEMTWKEVLNQVADKDLWEGIKREERPQWREYLKKADEISRKPRKPISKVRNRTKHANLNLVDTRQGLESSPHIENLSSVPCLLTDNVYVYNALYMSIIH